MKQAIILLAKRYDAALGKYLRHSLQAPPKTALRLGRESLALGVGTLELARIHESSLAGLLAADCLGKKKTRLITRAGDFFAGANSALEDGRRSELPTMADMSALRRALAQRSKELAAAHAQARQSVAERKRLVAAHEKSGKDLNRCLEESLQLQNCLRHLTHRLLASQEEERTKLGRKLQDEIVQTLLAINVQLLLLKQEARQRTGGFNEKLASTQRLVTKSVRSVSRVARKVGNA